MCQLTKEWVERKYPDHLTRQSFHFSKKKITSIASDALSNAPELLSFWADDNLLTTIPKDLFTKTPKLQLVSLRYNHLKSLPGKLFSKTPLLLSVDFFQNHLTSVPGELFCNSPTLYVVKCNCNHLTSLPGELFCNSPSLYDVNFNDNYLTTVPGELFATTPILKRVCFWNNQLTALPGELFFNTPEISWLMLNYAPSELFVYTRLPLRSVGEKTKIGDWDAHALLTDFELFKMNTKEIIRITTKNLKCFIHLRLCILAQFVTTAKQFEELAFCSAQQLQLRFHGAVKLKMVALSYELPIPEDLVNELW